MIKQSQVSKFSLDLLNGLALCSAFYATFTQLGERVSSRDKETLEP